MGFVATSLGNVALLPCVAREHQRKGKRRAGAYGAAIPARHPAYGG
jgi:hypothetical protein